MEYRLTGIPGALLRRVRTKAGDRLQDVLLGLLSAYADGLIDPLSDGDAVAAARGSRGGLARAAALSPDARIEQARAAAEARWRPKS